MTIKEFLSELRGMDTVLAYVDRGFLRVDLGDRHGRSCPIVAVARARVARPGPPDYYQAGLHKCNEEDIGDRMGLRAADIERIMSASDYAGWWNLRRGFLRWRLARAIKAVPA